MARALEISSAAVSGLLYGDFGPGRKVTERCRALLGVRPVLWDKACPANWKPHGAARVRPRPRRELASTGTDG